MSALPRSKVPQRSRGRAAGQPVALRLPPIHLIQSAARSFAIGGVDLSKLARSPCRRQVAVSRAGSVSKAGRRVEGRFRVEGRSPCRGQVAVARAGSRVEVAGQPQFSKKLADLCLYIYWPNQNERSEEKAGDGSVANRSSDELPPPALMHGGVRVGARRR